MRVTVDISPMVNTTVAITVDINPMVSTIVALTVDINRMANIIALAKMVVIPLNPVRIRIPAKINVDISLMDITTVALTADTSPMESITARGIKAFRLIGELDVKPCTELTLMQSN